MDADFVATWVEQYIRAWNTNDPADIGRLFTEDAAYYTGPFDEPWHGRDAIIAEWVGRQDAPGTTTFNYQVLAAQGDLGVVRGWTRYHDEPSREYGNLWLIRLAPDGRCREFTEWWRQKPAA